MRLLTCLAFSMRFIPLLKELEHSARDRSKEIDIKPAIDAIVRKEKITLALLDAELVIEAFTKR